MSSSAWLAIITLFTIVGLTVCLMAAWRALIWCIATIVLAVQEEIHLDSLDRIADTMEGR